MEVVVCNPAALTILRQGPEDLFAIPAVSIDKLGVGSGALTPAKRTRASVTLAWPGRMWLAGKGGYIKTLTVGDADIRVGEVVEVAGFPRMRGREVVLQNTRVRSTGRMDPVTPRVLLSEKVLEAGRDGEVVELEARLLRRMSSGTDDTLLMARAGETFFARIPRAVAGAKLDGLVEQSLLRPRGVVVLRADFDAPPDAFEILLPDAESVALIEAPPWWTMERMIAALGLMGICIGLALARAMRLQRRVSETQQRLTQAALAGPVAVAVLSRPEGRVVEVNDRFLSELGLDRGRVCGKTLMELAIWPDSPGWARLCRAIDDESESRNARVTWRTRSGEPRTMLLSAEPMELESQPCLVLSAVDVTEKAELLERLRDSQKMEAVGQLAAGIAHDFNNLLSIITTNAEMTGDELGANPDVRELNDEVIDAAGRASDLTRQLLTFSRKQPMTEHPLDLGNVVDGALRMLRRLLPESVAIEFHRRAEGTPIRADKGMLEQILVNLAVNARDAMSGGSVLTLETDVVDVSEDAAAAHPDRVPGRYTRLLVSDTGEGMDDATMKRVFEPFFTTKGIGHGSGLGLATVYGIASQHGGWVEIASAPGKGAHFAILLPLDATGESRASNDNKASDELPRGHEQILLVEDESGVRRAVGQALARAGYEVAEAEDGPTALELWNEKGGGFDLLLTDVLMPNGMTGVDLARRLKEKKPDLKTILMSGYSGDNIDMNELDAMGAVFPPKPITMAALARGLRETLSRETVAD